MSPTLSSTTHPQITHNEKFFSRVLSKENSTTNPSFRVLYYGVSTGSVPFLWESQPGTPKHPITDYKLPPLTPPPSYYESNKNANFVKSHKQTLFHALIPRLQKTSFLGSHRRGRSTSSSMSSSSSSSGGMPSSTTLCCYSVAGMKRALLSIVGSGSGHG